MFFSNGQDFKDKILLSSNNETIIIEGKESERSGEEY